MKSTLLAAALYTAIACSTPAYAQTDTTFTYQGSLLNNGSAANGPFNLDFSLFDALIGGNQIGSEVMFNGHPVVDGLFTVELDFGALAFDNTSRWIEISVNGTELSPRHAVTRSPYSIQTRGIFVDDNNNIGVGTSTPLYPLHVESDGDRSIVGVNHSTSGRGVFGHATASSGTTDGVFGQSDSTSGRGIDAWASASSGNTYGVFGTSSSTSGTGVRGIAITNTGTTYGGRFESASTSGRGVFGHATADTGTTYGGRFTSSSSTGTGVFGVATNFSGVNYGVKGHSNSLSGFSFFASGLGTNYGSSSSR